MRCSALTSVCRFQFTRFPNFFRPTSNLALAHFNSASSDSSSDEQTPFVSENHFNLCDYTLAWDCREVAELLYSYKWDPNQALSLFYDLKGRGFQHNVDTYVGIVRVVCQHGWGRQLEALLSEIMKLGFRMSELIEALFDKLEDDAEPSALVRVTGELVKAFASLAMYEEAIDLLFQTRKGFIPCVLSCNYLLNRLVEDDKEDTAMNLYQRLQRLGLAPNVYTNNIRIKAYCKQGRLQEAFDIVDQMGQDGVHNDFTYTTFIEGLCLQGLVDEGYGVLKCCRNKKRPLSNFAYAVVIRGFCEKGKLDKAEGVLLDIETQGLRPDVYCFGPLIQANYKCGKFDRVLDLHGSMVMKGVKTNCVVVSSVLQSLCCMGMASEAAECFLYFQRSGIYLDKISYNVMVDSLCKSGKMDEAKYLVNQMESRRMAPDVIHYSTLINGYCLAGNLDEAKRVFNSMGSKRLEPDIVVYNILIGAYYRHGQISGAEFFIRRMNEQGLKLDAGTYRVMIQGLCVGGNVKEAEKLFNRVVDKSLDLYHAMVSGYCEANHINDAYDFFCEFCRQGISMNKKCCVQLMNCLLMEGEYDKAVFVFRNSPILEISPCIKTVSRLISSVCEAGNLRTAREIFDDWVQRSLETDVIMYTIMINGYCKANCIEEANKLFKDMKIRGMSPDIVTYTVVMNGQLNSCLKKTYPYPEGLHGKELMNTVLSPLQREMEDVGICRDVVYYTVLIEKHCKLHNYQDAFDLHERMIERGVKPDNVSYCALLSAYYKSGNVDGASTFIDEMRVNGVHTDEITNLLEGTILKATRIRIK